MLAECRSLCAIPAEAAVQAGSRGSGSLSNKDLYSFLDSPMRGNDNTLGLAPQERRELFHRTKMLQERFQLVELS